MVAIHAGKAVDASLAKLSGKLRLTLIAILAGKVALADAIIIFESLVVNLALAPVGARYVSARVGFFTIEAQKAVRTSALVVGGRFERAHAAVHARYVGAQVEYFTLSAAIVGRTLARIVELVRVFAARTAVEATLCLIETVGRWRHDIGRYVAVEARPVRRTLARIAVERVRTRATVEARIRVAKVAILAKCARVLWIRASTQVAARDALVVHERYAHARVQARRRQTRIVDRIRNT